MNGYCKFGHQKRQLSNGRWQCPVCHACRLRNARLRAAESPECPECGARWTRRLKADGTFSWQCYGCRVVGRKRNDEREKAEAERNRQDAAARAEYEAEIELAKDAARSKVMQVHLYFDPREVARRANALTAEQARRRA